MWNAFKEKFFADFLRIYRALPRKLQRQTLVIFAAVLLQALLEVGSIMSISFLAMAIASPERLANIRIVAAILHYFPVLDGLRQDQRLFALVSSGGVVAFIAAKNLVTAKVSYLTALLSQRIGLYAGEVIFHNFLYSPYIKQLSGDGNAMFQALAWRDSLGGIALQLLSVYSYAGVSLALAITLIFVTPGIILVIVVSMGLIAYILYKLLRRLIDKAGSDVAEWTRASNNVTLNALNGVREALIYRQQKVFFKNFREDCFESLPARSFLNIAPPIPTWVLETAGFGVLLATLWVMYAFLDASMAHITAVLTMIMLISWRVLPLFNRSMSALVVVRSMRYSAMQCLERVEQALAEPEQEAPEPDPDFAFREGIVLDHVFFRYPKAESDSLMDVCFAVPKGNRVGIVGQSGAGKSSLATILSGLVPPTEGRMLVDGRVLSPSELSAYRQRVGYVPQNPYILAGSLAENVAFSQWGKPWDEQKVLDACRMAELDIVEDRGIDLKLGQGGGGLSGGQAQRLSIARALYAEPSVLILDEATSALDTGVEKAIMKTIFSLPQSITAIIIAHRLTTVKRCDSLVWIEGGRVQAVGAPAEILPKYEDFLEAIAQKRLCENAKA